MTEEQKFLFDLHGFLLIEDLLTPDECAALIGQVDQMVHHPEALPAAHRAVPGGQLATLVNHPKILPFLHACLGPHVRMDAGEVAWQRRGEGGSGKLRKGGPMEQPMLRYQVVQGRIFAGLLRVVFELREVGPEDGGCVFLPGSHKANFPVPASFRHLEAGRRSPYLRQVACPAGSAIIYTDNVASGELPWRNPEWDRVTVAYSFNHVGMQYHKPKFREEVIGDLSAEQREFFKEIWVFDV